MGHSSRKTITPLTFALATSPAHLAAVGCTSLMRRCALRGLTLDEKLQTSKAVSAESRDLAQNFSGMRYRLSATTICLLSMSAASASVRSSSIRWKSLCFSVSCTPIVLKRRAFPFMSTPRTVTSQ